MSEHAKWQLAAWAAIVVLVVVAGARAIGPLGGEDAPAPVPIEAAGGEGKSREGKDGATIYVHVAGAVRRPGLYRVREGARVAGAVEKAGGLGRRAELTAVNLAQRLEDGQQVIVPEAVTAPGAAPPSGAARTPPSVAGGAPISLATATVEQLEELDGIGPTLAQRILDQRDERGGFRSVEELREVDGIGEKRLEALEGAVRP